MKRASPDSGSEPDPWEQLAQKRSFAMSTPACAAAPAAGSPLGEMPSAEAVALLGVRDQVFARTEGAESWALSGSRSAWLDVTLFTTHHAPQLQSWRGCATQLPPWQATRASRALARPPCAASCCETTSEHSMCLMLEQLGRSGASWRALANQPANPMSSSESPEFVTEVAADGTGSIRVKDLDAHIDFRCVMHVAPAQTAA